MDVKQTLASWSAMETILSAVSIVFILGLGTFIH
jgi:H+/gluconate symporter-like permease